MRIHAWAVGLFLVLGIGLATAILFLIGNRHDVFGRHAEFYSEFADVSGLPNGAQVRVSGLEAGEVKGIEIPANPASKFRVKLQVKESVRGMIRTDSVVSIQTEGIVGDKYISVREGTISAAEAPDGATLPGKEPFNLSEVMEKGSALLNDVQGSVKDIHGRLDVALDTVTKTVNHVNGLVGHVDGAVAHVDGIVTTVAPDIRRMASNAGQITGTVNGIVSDLNAGKGPVGLLLKDQATRQQIQAIVSNARQASLNLTDISARADQFVADL
jgi:phospholipid/cholesterol/gamma-HCH transport system substrate-binding protein